MPGTKPIIVEDRHFAKLSCGSLIMKIEDSSEAPKWPHGAPS